MRVALHEFVLDAILRYFLYLVPRSCLIFLTKTPAGKKFRYTYTRSITTVLKKVLLDAIRQALVLLICHSYVVHGHAMTLHWKTKTSIQMVQDCIAIAFQVLKKLYKCKDLYLLPVGWCNLIQFNWVKNVGATRAHTIDQLNVHKKGIYVYQLLIQNLARRCNFY